MELYDENHFCGECQKVPTKNVKADFNAFKEATLISVSNSAVVAILPDEGSPKSRASSNATDMEEYEYHSDHEEALEGIAEAVNAPMHFSSEVVP